jgi:hypothetical protein
MSGFQSTFLIVKRFETLYRSWEHRCPRGEGIYSLPEEGIEPEAVARKYRGTDREPLEGLSLEVMARIIRNNPSSIDINERAAMLAIHYLTQGEHGLPFFTLDQVRDVYLTLGNPTKWEIIWVSIYQADIEPPPQTSLLGYEPCWFPDDGFSAICDCMCFPRWHGTDEEGTLFAGFHARLNENGLFNSPYDAKEFLDFYQSQDWTETGEYTIVAVYAFCPGVYAAIRSAPDYKVWEPGRPERLSGDALEGMSWEILLTQYEEGRKISCIKALRDLLPNMGLAEAKNLVEHLPKVVALVYIGELQTLIDILTQAEFTYQISPYQ